MFSSLALAMMVGCANTGGAPASEVADDENLIGASATYSDEADSEETLDERYGARSELSAKSKPKEKCRGKGKKRKCSMVDPTPKVSAAHGARTFIGDFRWGMDAKAVMDQLTRQISDEYDKKQSETNDANVQDANRAWKRDQITSVAKSHVRFDSAAHHKWGVSVIQFDYMDDEGEEMVWIKGATLKKFYFFRDGELWKINYAYGKQAFPGMDYKGVLDSKFKKWFGVMPEEKAKLDPKTQVPLVNYVQWDSQDGDRIRAYDMMEVHGVFLVSVVSGNAEDSIGERLPNMAKERAFDEEVGDVLGGSDICYDEEGNMIEDAERCKELRGF